MVQRRASMRLRPNLLLPALVLAGGLAACSNGVEAGTLDPPSATGVQLDVGDLRIRNAVIVDGEDGQDTVSMTLVNVGDAEDTLAGVTVGDEPVAAALQPGSITLPPGSATVIPGETEPTIELEEDLDPGGYALVTLELEQAGSVQLSLPVISSSSPYAGGSD